MKTLKVYNLTYFTAWFLLFGLLYERFFTFVIADYLETLPVIASQAFFIFGTLLMLFIYIKYIHSRDLYLKEQDIQSIQAKIGFVLIDLSFAALIYINLFYCELREPYFGLSEQLNISALVILIAGILTIMDSKRLVQLTSKV